MKKLFLALLILVSIGGFAQVSPSGLPTIMGQKWYQVRQFISVDSGLIVNPRSLVGFTPRFAGTLAVNGEDSALYLWDGAAFRLIGGQTGFGIYNAGNGLLLSGGFFRVDTTTISTILRLNKLRDSISSLLDSYALRTTTLSAGNGLLGGGDLSANRSFSVDTAIISTKNNRNKLKDSVYASLNNYTPTSRNITTSFGLLGGGNLTTDRTLSADSIALQTRLRGIKLVDSTMALVVFCKVSTNH